MAKLHLHTTILRKVLQHGRTIIFSPKDYLVIFPSLKNNLQPAAHNRRLFSTDNRQKDNNLAYL